MHIFLNSVDMAIIIFVQYHFRTDCQALFQELIYFKVVKTQWNNNACMHFHLYVDLSTVKTVLPIRTATSI